MRYTLLAMILTCLALTSRGADFSGTWEGKVENPEGPLTVRFVLTPTTEHWSGEVTVSEWGTFPLQKITTDGDSISFEVQGENGTWTQVATLKDGQLHVTVSGPEGPLPPLIMKHLPAPIDGRWQGLLKLPDDDLELVFSFHRDGGNVTGSIESPMGTTPFLSGSIDGNTVTWQSDYQGMTVHYVAHVAGDAMDVAIRSPEWEFKLPLVRETDPAPPATPQSGL